MAKTEVVTKLEERAIVVRERIIEVRDDLENSYMTLADLLHEVHSNAYFEQVYGYESFRDYVEKELGMKYRRARYLVIIADKVKKLGLSWDRIVSIGWSRMLHIAPKLTDKNVNKWLDLAEKSTASELAEIVRDAGSCGDLSNLTAPKIHSVQLRMNEDQHSIIMDACDIAKRMIGSESTVDALEHISYDWIQQSTDGPSKTPLESVIKWAEKVYGVELESVGGQNLASLLAVGGEKGEVGNQSS